MAFPEQRLAPVEAEADGTISDLERENLRSRPLLGGPEWRGREERWHMPSHFYAPPTASIGWVAVLLCGLGLHRWRRSPFLPYRRSHCSGCGLPYYSRNARVL